jgi:hypothetical protein|tara:strand:+ start:1257 stop:1367 length:111 start_codon:yes stop_codon:yes gene_type:complete
MSKEELIDIVIYGTLLMIVINVLKIYGFITRYKDDK